MSGNNDLERLIQEDFEADSQNNMVLREIPRIIDMHEQETFSEEGERPERSTHSLMADTSRNALEKKIKMDSMKSKINPYSHRRLKK